MAKHIMQISTKRILINKANSTIVLAVGVAAFLTAFSLVASRSLLAKRSYQARVIVAQEKARDQLAANIAAVDTLKASYKGFVDRQQNIIGGSATGNSERDGDNAKIVLDALPSKYDFPALAASVEKILSDRSYDIQSINGVDDELNQNSSDSAAQLPAQDSLAQPSSAALPQTQTVGAAVEMPFELTAGGSYASMIDLLKVFDSSIRPLYIQKIVMTASSDGASSATAQMTIQGKSYYQPGKTLSIKSEVVK